MWFTHNEPWCQAFLGYQTGLFAPGNRDFGQALRCAHHLLVSHGLAVRALRAHVKKPIGIAINIVPAHPASSSEADARAAARFDGYFNRWFIEPLLGRGYPPDMVALYGPAMPEFPASDLALMGEPIDVLGINYYDRALIAAGDEPPLHASHVRPSDTPRTADREIYPAGLSHVLQRLHEEYGFKQLVVTENGAAFPDELSSDGRVHDVERVAFFRAHLQQMLKARQRGVPVDAYFAWSLLDNFEWSEGYTLRYGLVHVDFETQVRLPKDSAEFFRSLGRHAGTAREAESFAPR
jgi:beta-glucosidase